MATPAEAGESAIIRPFGRVLHLADHPASLTSADHEQSRAMDGLSRVGRRRAAAVKSTSQFLVFIRDA